MQSLDMLRQLAVLDRERIEHILTQHNRLRVEGRFPEMREYYSENCVLELLGNPRYFAHAGLYDGRNAVVGALGQLGMEVEFLRSDVSDVLIDHDRAMMRAKVRVRHRGTGMTANHEIWDIFRFEDGLIIHHSKFIDLKSYDNLLKGGR